MSLAFITQNRLEIAGALGAALAAYWLPLPNAIGIWACVAVYFLARYVPKAFAFLKGFADNPQWPMLVACGVGIVFFGASGAHGLASGFVRAGLVAAIDGDFWPY